MNYVVTPPDAVSIPVHGTDQRFPVRRIYCVGRNYVEHAKEMGFTGREPPFFFMKPADAIVFVPDGETGSIRYPLGTKSLHHEIELVVAIGKGGETDSPPSKAKEHVYGYAVGLDMTRRDLQGEAKKAGRPWEIGKGFDQSAPIGPIHPLVEHRLVRQGRDHAAGQRQGHAAEHHRQADLECRRDHRAPVVLLGAGARRPDLLRHAGRGRGRGKGRPDGR